MRNLNRLLLLGAGGFHVLCTSLLAQPDHNPFRLIDAINSNQIAAAETLIVKGSETFLVDGHGRSPVWHAAAKGQNHLVDLMVKCGVGLDDEDRFGVSPLVVAIKRGHAKVVSNLIAAGARINARQGARFIPLHVAVEQAESEVVFALLAAGTDPLIQQETGDPGTDLVRNSLIRSRLKGMTRSYFLFLGAGETARFRFPLKQTIQSADLEVRDSSGSLVYRVAISGPLSGPEIEVEWDMTDYEGNEIEPGRYSVSLGFPDRSRRSQQRNAIHFSDISWYDAAAYATPRIVKAWLSIRVRVDSQNEAGRTALMLAAAFGNVEMVALLLSSGADPAITDSHGETAHSYASRFAPGQPVGRLLENASGISP